MHAIVPSVASVASATNAQLTVPLIEHFRRQRLLHDGLQSSLSDSFDASWGAGSETLLQSSFQFLLYHFWFYFSVKHLVMLIIFLCLSCITSKKEIKENRQTLVPCLLTNRTNWNLGIDATSAEVTLSVNASVLVATNLHEELEILVFVLKQS